MSDIVINQVNSLSSQVNTKVSFLILLEDGIGNKKTIKKFVTIDKIDIYNSYIDCKGFFIDQEPDEIYNNLQSILTERKKDLSCIQHMMFPWSRVLNIRNLIFRQKQDKK